MSYEKYPDNKAAIVDGSNKLKNEYHIETTFTTETDIVSEEVQLRDPPDGGWKAWLVVVGSFCVSHLLFVFIPIRLPIKLRN